ncbi:MAG: hypothetical protein LBD68_04580 [Zoogloeaceae bacterium]|jgi:hypothetical protein|nr:hypothetical protein [Zoogloeaceae bacterium]
MPHLVSHVDDANGQWAHYNFIETLADFAAANGWQVLRHDAASENRELILKGAGHTGEEEIFVGLRTYQSENNDYYNLLAATFTGHVPDNPFDGQPGATLSGVPAHNQRIDFWLSLNPQRIACAMKVGTPVYESFYLGKMLPYARPSQYPYPIVCAGMLNGAAATRFSDTAHAIPYKGNRNNFKLRANDNYLQPYSYPWSNGYFADRSYGNFSSATAGKFLRDTGGQYPLLPVELHTSTDLWGQLDGVAFVSGFNVVVEDTLTIDGTQWVVIEDVYRTAWGDYYALRLDD